MGLPSLERGRRVKKGPLAQSQLGTPRKTSQNGEQMAGDMGHMGGLISPNTKLFFQIPVGLPSLERRRRVKKGPLAQSQLGTPRKTSQNKQLYSQLTAYSLPVQNLTLKRK